MTTIYPKIAEVNVETGETVIREQTDAEKALYDADQLAIVEANKVAKAEETAKAALLTKLGITADEAKLLLS